MQVTEIKLSPSNAGNPIRLAAYCRVSSSSEDQLHSYAAQIRRYSEYAREHPEYELVDIYADEGLTGTSIQNRDEMLRLIRDCQKGKIDRIITKSVSRFARNTMELLETIRALKEYGVSVFFEEQGIDTNQLNSEMIVTFPGMAAQQESMEMSGRIRWSYRKRMESGDFITCSPPYGYDLVEGNLVIKDDEASIIQRIFEMYLTGMGKQSIANRLNQDHVPRRPGEGRWFVSTIHYILNNERYIGDALLQKKYTTDTLPYKQKVNKGLRPQYYVENSHPSIINREVYQKAQEQQKRKATPPPHLAATHLLSRLLFCPECGRAFRKIVSRGTVYWICNGKASGETNCQRRLVTEKAVYAAFSRLTEKLADSSTIILGGLISQLETLHARFNGGLSRANEIDKEIRDLAAQNHVLTIMNKSGAFTPEEYEKKAFEISTQLKALRQERRKLISEDEDIEQIIELKELSELLDSCHPEAFDESLFKKIVERIIVNDNTSLTFHLIGGLKLTENIAPKERCKTK